MFQKLNSDKYDAIFYNIYKNSKLVELNLPGNNLSSVNPDLFGSAVTKLRSVNLCDTRISKSMLSNLFQKMCVDSNLLSLDLSHNRWYKSISPHLFAEAMIGLTSINLKRNRVTEQQMSSLLSSMAGPRSKLRSINFSGVSSLARTEPESLARAVLTVRSAVLYATKLTQYQLYHILMALGNFYSTSQNTHIIRSEVINGRRMGDKQTKK